MSTLSIRRALENQLKAIGSVPIAPENVTYTPVIGVAYLQMNLLPANTYSPCAGAASAEMVQESGVFQVTVVCPIGEGSKRAASLAEDVRDLFPKGLTMTFDGVDVMVEQSGSVAPGSISGEWYTVPVSIPYFSTIFK